MDKQNQCDHNDTESDKQQSQNQSVNHQFFQFNRMATFHGLQNLTQKQSLIMKLNNNGIKFDQEKNKRNPTFKFRPKKSNIQSTIYIAQYGCFQMQLSLLRINLPSNIFSHRLSIGSGAFGKVSVNLFQGEKYAVKMIPFANKNLQQGQYFNKMIQSILKEIFITKIASALQVGPKFYGTFSYDVIVYTDGAEFALEKCQTYFNDQKIKHEKKNRNLQQGLKILHGFKICHSDITDQNIAWSPQKEKMVFLDFGLSKIIYEDKGEKTLTSFVGSYWFTSPQMKKLYNLKNKGLVDLYQNDSYGLNKVMGELIPKYQKQFSFKLYQDQNLNKQEQFYPSLAFIPLYQIKYWIFIKNCKQVENVLKNNIDNKQILSILSKVLLEQWELAQQKPEKQIIFQLYNTYLKGKEVQKIEGQNKKVYEYLDSLYNGEQFSDIEQKIIMYSDLVQQSDIGEYWGIFAWMKAIFWFLVPKDKKVQKEKRRIKIVNELYDKLKTQITQLQSYEQYKYYFILCNFKDYFIEESQNENSNIEQIYEMMDYLKACFILLGDFGANQQIQLQIVKIMRDPIQKMEKIYQFFFCKNLIFGRYSLIIQSKIDYKRLLGCMNFSNETQNVIKIVLENQKKYLKNILCIQKDIQSYLNKHLQNSNCDFLFEKIGHYQKIFDDSKLQGKSVNFCLQYCRSYILKQNYLYQGIQNAHKTVIDEPLFQIFPPLIDKKIDLKRNHLQILQKCQFQIFVSKPSLMPILAIKLSLYMTILPIKTVFQSLIQIYRTFMDSIPVIKQSEMKKKVHTHLILQIIEIICENSHIYCDGETSKKKEQFLQMIQQMIKLIEPEQSFQLKQFMILRMIMNGKRYEVLQYLIKSYWSAANEFQKFSFVYQYIKFFLDLSPAIRSNQSLLMLSDIQKMTSFSSMMKKFNNQLYNSGAIIMVYKQLGKFNYALKVVIFTFAKIKKFGKMKIDKSLEQLLQIFESQIPKQTLLQNIRALIQTTTLKNIYQNQYGDFFFALFCKLYRNVKKDLSLQDKKRLVILSICLRSSFSGEDCIVMKNYMRQQIWQIFQMKALKKKKYNKKLWHYDYHIQKWVSYLQSLLENIPKKFQRHLEKKIKKVIMNRKKK